MYFHDVQCSFCNNRDKCEHRKLVEKTSDDIRELVEKNKEGLEKVDFRVNISCHNYNYYRKGSGYDGPSDF